MKNKPHTLVLLIFLICIGIYDIAKMIFFSAIVFVGGLTVIILYGAYDAYLSSTSKSYRLRHG